MIKAVIFDLDGVLVDSEELSRQSNKETLKQHGIELTQEEKIKAIGRTDLDIFRDMIEARGLGLSPEELTKEKDRIYLDIIKGKLKPIPGARGILETLKERGIPFAIASSGTYVKVRANLSETGLIGLISTIISADDIEKGKPDPEIFLKAAEKIGIPPEECLVIEDAQAGVIAAKAAGMKCLALKSPGSHGQDLSQADRVISSLEEAREEF